MPGYVYISVEKCTFFILITICFFVASVTSIALPLATGLLGYWNWMVQGNYMLSGSDMGGTRQSYGTMMC
jgi:hypothetical protein